MAQNTKTAALLIIGNEILSGRTKDKNMGWLAENLTAKGINLTEARVIADIPDAIIEAVNTLRKTYDYVFTTGGIGPTHDDITAECIAKAFDAELFEDPEARRRLEVHYAESGSELNEARLKMAKVPRGSTLIDNPVSAAPGFQIENVYVMAGVPRIMQAMFDGIASGLVGGDEILSVEMQFNLGEGDIADALTGIQAAYPDIDIGSYPSYKGGKFSVSVVLRHTDQALLSEAANKVDDTLRPMEATKKSGLGG